MVCDEEDLINAGEAVMSTLCCRQDVTACCRGPCAFVRALSSNPQVREARTERPLPPDAIKDAPGEGYHPPGGRWAAQLSKPPCP